MKICIISPPAIETPPQKYGGAELVVHLLAEELSRDHDVTVIAAEGSQEGRYKLLETIPPSYRGLEGEKEHYLAYRDFILQEDHDWDLIMSHEHFFYAYKLKQEHADLNLVWHVHDLLPARSPPPVRVPIYARSRFHARYLSSMWDRRVSYRYNPVDIHQYKSSSKREDFFLFLGRLDAKGALEFIEVCKAGGLRGVIAGEDSTDKGIDPHVVWKTIRESHRSGVGYLGGIGNRKKIELLTRAKGLIIPFADNYTPVFDLVFVEALASGCPVITRDRGAVRELIKHGRTGFIADNLDEIPGYARRLEEISPTTCRQNARKFKTDKIAKEYM